MYLRLFCLGCCDSTRGSSTSMLWAWAPARAPEGELFIWLPGAMGEVSQSDAAVIGFCAVGLSVNIRSSDERIGPAVADSEAVTMEL